MPTGVNNEKLVRAPSSSDEGASGVLRSTSCILDAIPEGISLHSSSGEIKWVNRSLCDIYGRSLTELKGLSCSQVFHVDGGGCPHDQVLATGLAVRLVDEVQVSGRNFSVTVEPLFEKDSEPRGFIRMMRDLTSKGHAREQLLKAERFATLGQLLSGVLHDVGTPLNVISGYAEFLLMRTKPEDGGYKELSAIIDQTRRIATMFGEALDLARPAQGRSDAIDIQGLLAGSLDLAGYHLRQAGVTASLTCRIGKPLIYGEAPQLRQAVFNLLLNAGEHLGAGGRLKVVLEEATNRPGFMGVALAFLGTEASGAPHDFSTCFGVLCGSQSETETTGIGLYLTRRILEEAGASVLFTDAGEQGTGLIIYLPVQTGSRP